MVGRLNACSLAAGGGERDIPGTAANDAGGRGAGMSLHFSSRILWLLQLSGYLSDQPILARASGS